MSTSYGDGDDKNKFNTEKSTKSLKKLRNKLINYSEFKEEYINLWIMLKILKIINLKKS